MIQFLASKTRQRRLAMLLGGLVLTAVAFATLHGDRVEVARVEQGEMR